MTDLHFTMDGREARVAPGTTILEAARGLGIRIPTLCQVEDLEPSASCFLCTVQVEGRGNLSPSCALPVAEGMVVTTDSDDIRETRKMALELLLSDHAGECAAPCSRGCPAELDIPGFILEVAEGREAQAAAVLARTLPLPGALGRVCPRLCEQSCHRCGYDESLSIGALHRHVADRDCASDDPHLPAKRAPSGKSVAIIGAGPAGLAAATYLQQEGHACTLYDAHEEPGGMLRYGIPAYRLPREALAAEVEVVKRLGASFRMGVRIGQDVELIDLREEHDAVFMAIGAQHARSLGCPGEELALSGIELLASVARGERPELGSRVVVVGGGNTAMDAARTALRLVHQPQQNGGSNPSVSVLYRRTREEMPCLLEEVEEAEEEGASIELLVAPIALERADEGRLQVTCQRMQLGEPDASGRRRPVPIEGSEHVIEATTVIAATGQSVDLSLARGVDMECSGWGIQADPVTLATSLEGVFAGGDAVLGPDLAVRAVAAGRRAAGSIDRYLRKLPLVPERVVYSTFEPIDEQELAKLFRKIEHGERAETARLDPARRLATFEEVDGGLLAEAVLPETRRCMTCGCSKADGCALRNMATEYGADADRFSGPRRRMEQDHSHPDILYEPGKCIACDACVRVAHAEGEPLGLTLVGRGFEVAVAAPFGEPLSKALSRAAVRCAEVCPTGALSLRAKRACESCFVQLESNAYGGARGTPGAALGGA